MMTLNRYSPGAHEFGYNQSILINVGDEKGRILDGAMAKARPARVLELEPTAATAPCAWRSPRPLRNRLDRILCGERRDRTPHS